MSRNVSDDLIIAFLQSNLFLQVSCAKSKTKARTEISSWSSNPYSCCGTAFETNTRVAGQRWRRLRVTHIPVAGRRWRLLRLIPTLVTGQHWRYLRFNLYPCGQMAFETYTYSCGGTAFVAFEGNPFPCWGTALAAFDTNTYSFDGTTLAAIEVISLPLWQDGV